MPWFVCASWHNSVITKNENQLGWYTMSDYCKILKSLINPNERIKSSLLTVDQSITNELQTAVQSLHELITGENYDNWVKSFSKNFKVDNTLVVFDECQGGPYTYQPFATKVKDSNFSQTAVNCLLRKPPLNALLVSTRHWSFHSATN